MDNLSNHQSLKCLSYGVGICVMLGIYGVLQETVMSVEYDGELFKDSAFLVLCNRLFAVLFSAVMLGLHKESASLKAPLWKYVVISLSNVAATTCQYEALKWVSFPVQMLGKSFKMMPVMVWGIVISQKKYKLSDWIVAAAVTVGVTEFLMTGDISASHADEGDSVKGLLLLVCFLAFDGLTSTMQEKLFKESRTSKFNQMFYVNACSTVTSVMVLLVSGGFGEALAFCAAHPAFIKDANLLSAAAVGGQFFIYSMVEEFGALAFAAAMNVRQVLSIVVSYSVFEGKTISPLQVGGLLLVFGALFGKVFAGMAGGNESQRLLPKPLGVGHASASKGSGQTSGSMSDASTASSSRIKPDQKVHD